MNFWTWWQNWPLSFDGTFLSIGSFQVQYYGLMYIVGLLASFLVLKWRFGKGELKSVENFKIVEDLLFGLMVCVLIGGRLGYVVFYSLEYFLANPLEIVWPFRDGQFTGLAGMSFHGGLLLCLLYGIWFVKKKNLDFWKTSDELIVVAPLAYFFGRIGNFLNSELFGRVTDVNWGMKFQGAGEVLRHPSQLYQAFGEGFLVFVLLWVTRNMKNLDGYRLGLFIGLFGLMRFLMEFFRQPDEHIGLLIDLSRGQYLSLMMILAGIIIVVFSKNTRKG